MGNAFSNFMKSAADFAVTTFSGGVRFRLGTRSCAVVLGEADMAAELLGGTDQFMDSEQAQVMGKASELRLVNGGEIPAAETQFMLQVPDEPDAKWQISRVRYSPAGGDSVTLDVRKV